MKSTENGDERKLLVPSEAAAALVLGPAWFGVVAAGGGARILGWLTSRPGCSRILAEGVVPYGGDALARLLGEAPASAVSAEVALRLATGAHRRAARTAPADRIPIGVACTAAFVTDRRRRGEEQAFLCAVSAEGTRSVHLRFRKGIWDRDRQEEAVVLEILRLMAIASGLEGWGSAIVGDGSEVRRAEEAERTQLGRLTAGQVSWIRLQSDGRSVPGGAASAALLPGSFYPLHPGHLGMAEAAEQLLGMPVDLELSLANADKADLPLHEARRRIDAIAGVRPLLVTRAGTFLEKARLFPGRWFVLGYDTAARLVCHRYYGGPAGWAAAVEEFVRLDCRFLVAARRTGDTLRTLEDVPVPEGLSERFRAIPVDRFREDISSTDLRKGWF